ncbi:uncharacterized protein BO96DRAFT_437452 [Aspergillus niger CBS 101883]|uniref:uncharacterized protein n=1 Tax=Aspergillus lacticoffeatus (strain CBS 101883) TaxID=1450533 RepID=UPI000D7ECC27|nr:uncharacterized protein BO96DRAFT_437452 [Aspergillus niger CBS 101883]PYH53159.1 hypothetical protein BO96DRAFT_437452 [Aspergillus niger CBS 101883]
MPCSSGRADQCGAPDPGGAQLGGVGRKEEGEREGEGGRERQAESNREAQGSVNPKRREAASGPITARNVPTFPLSPDDNASIRGLPWPACSTKRTAGLNRYPIGTYLRYYNSGLTYRRRLSSFHSSLGGTTPALSHMQPITSAAETCRIYFAYKGRKKCVFDCINVLPSQALTLTHRSLLPIKSVGHNSQVSYVLSPT